PAQPENTEASEPVSPVSDLAAPSDAPTETAGDEQNERPAHERAPAISPLAREALLENAEGLAPEDEAAKAADITQDEPATAPADTQEEVEAAAVDEADETESEQEAPPAVQ